MSIMTHRLSVAALLAAAVIAPAFGQTTGEDRQRLIIAFDPADLMTKAGRLRIDARLARAADRVCTPDDRPTIAVSRVDRACRDAALNDARRQLAQRVGAAQGRVEVAAVEGQSGSH
ncbi:MAG: hypothetical protein BVN33_16560 [Proteobacteria bacterium ST_bin13]|nr:MAG: hypothetical protein BVN33_16560 [Proteobacteria bacterium ST_bin13]